jgi:hypothetical protein
MDSNDLEIKTNAILVTPTIIPGGNIHHHIPLAAAAEDCASFNICPHVGVVGSPSPMKLRPVSVKMAAGTDRAIVAKAKAITAE